MIVIPGDVRDPGAVLAAIRASSIDLSAPACVIIALVLHFIDAETAARLARLYNHSVAEFASFFSGLEVIPPGFTDAQLWRAGWQDAAEPGDAPGRAFVGVGRVPE